jgi:folate-binding protein YgfZ
MPQTRSLAEAADMLERTTGVRVRSELALVRVTGDDRASWLNGQVTNDVRQIAPGTSVYALAVNVRGKVMSELWVVDRGAELVVLMPESTREAVLAGFEQQIIMEDVTLATEPAARVVSLQGPLAAEALEASGLLGYEAYAADELGHGGLLLITSEPELSGVLAQLVAGAETVGGGEVGDDAFELARVRSGRPRFGRDFGQQNYPQEAGLKRLAVSFNKGCYLGQEVVCTLENRGKLTRQLVRLQQLDGSAPEAGAELRDGEGASPGKLTSVVLEPRSGRALALGYVKRAQTAPGTELHAGAARMQVLGLAGGD